MIENKIPTWMGPKPKVSSQWSCKVGSIKLKFSSQIKPPKAQNKKREYR